MTSTLSKGIGQHIGFISNTTFSETKNCNFKFNKNVLRQTASWPLAQAAALFLLGLGFWAVRSDAESGNQDLRENNDGNECTIVWGWFPWPPSSSFPVFAFIPLLPNLLFFPYCSLSPCLNSLPHPLLSLLPLLFSCLCPCSDALTCPNTGKTWPGHISCRKPRHVSRQAQSVSSQSQKSWVHPPKHTPLFMVPLLSWCLTKPTGVLIHSGSLTGTFQLLVWSHGFSEPHLSL